MPVITSYEDADGRRCVDVIQRDDRAVILKEFRRDPEDGGRWRLVADYSRVTYANEDEALAAAKAAFPWLASIGRRRA